MQSLTFIHLNRLVFVAILSLGVGPGLARGQEGDSRAFVERGRADAVVFPGGAWTTVGDRLVGEGAKNTLLADRWVGRGDCRIRAVLAVKRLGWSGAALRLGGSRIEFDGRERQLRVRGPLFGRRRSLGPTAKYIEAGRSFTIEIIRRGRSITVTLDGASVQRAEYGGAIGRIGFSPGRAILAVHSFEAKGHLTAIPKPQPRGYEIPIVDLSSDEARQVVVDREPGRYLGHPTTVLLEDGKTMLCVYPGGHGRGPIIMKRSTDGGITWSERLPVPKNWATSKETPTIHRVVDSKGTKRLILFSGLHPIRMARSDDDGETWTALEKIGDYGGIVAMAAVERLANGDYVAFFHDDGRFLRKKRRGRRFEVYQVVSGDGGLTWSEPRVIAEHPTAHLCEPGFIRSPDGKRIALLLRENSRRHNSFVIFSDDEGRTWSEPRELPAALTGDRHTGRYAPDGRLLISFRDTTRRSETKGDWVAWVGRWEDIAEGREGECRIRLMDNHVRGDCAYPGVECLPDGTFVLTTYGHWTKGERPYVVSVRLRLSEVDERLAARQK